MYALWRPVCIALIATSLLYPHNNATCSQIAEDSSCEILVCVHGSPFFRALVKMAPKYPLYAQCGVRSDGPKRSDHFLFTVEGSTKAILCPSRRHTRM